MKRSKNNDGSRRYPEGKHPVYHQTYSKLERTSYILNKEIRSNDFHNSTALYGIGECKSTLISLVGNPLKDGMYLYNDQDWKLASIPVAENQLKSAVTKFKRWQKDQVRQGKALTPPKEWPDNLLPERLRAEALLDIRHKEKATVEARIKELEDRHRKRPKEQPVLPNGPLGLIGEPKGKIKAADGQRVSYSPEGIPFIDEPDSPYNGMPIANYRQMCKRWKRAMGITLPQLRERRDELYEEARQEARKAGEEPPVKKLVVTHSKLPVWMKRLGITKKDWPEWPEDAKPISELEEV